MTASENPEAQGDRFVFLPGDLVSSMDKVEIKSASYRAWAFYGLVWSAIVVLVYYFSGSLPELSGQPVSMQLAVVVAATATGYLLFFLPFGLFMAAMINKARRTQQQTLKRGSTADANEGIK